MSKNKNNKQTICLNMIVKNESHVIIKTLNNLLSYISFDYWVISDTGSSDNTKELIIDFFKNKNIPGELVEHEWKDFGYNRSIALECAFNKTDYLFVFDADDTINGNLILPDMLISDKYDFIFGKGFTYIRPLLVNNRKQWKYIGVLHEYIISSNILSSSLMEGDYFIDSGKTGSRSNDPDKYFKDAIILKNAFQKEINNDFGLACRYAFYCAQSYRDAGPNFINESLEWYLKCLELDNWKQEKFFSCIMIGNFYEGKKDFNNAYKYWIKSVEYDPERMDGIIIASGKLLESGNFILVNLLYNKYKKYKTNLTEKLFLYDFLYNGQFEFNNSIAAFYADDLESGYSCCKKILSEKKIIIPLLQKTISNLSFYKKCIQEDEKTIDLFYDVNNILTTSFKSNFVLEKEWFNIWNMLWEKNKNKLCKFKKCPIKNKANKPSIFVSITTCKRFELFTKTVNSILNHWMDIDKVEYWFCVDDNSSEIDRVNMQKLYGWMDFYMKTPEEKGHLKSMNIIWNKLNELKPTYWIHLEDDFIFFDKMNYIEKAIEGLELLKNDNVKQILFNINYSELISDYTIRSHKKFNDDFVIHDYKEGVFMYDNCHYWPHYSFRPSLTEVDTIIKLGNFDTNNTFFERNYADNWNTHGYKSAFFNKITHIHTGRLTTEINNPNKLNAYKLNKEDQFYKTNNDNVHLVIQEKEEEIKQLPYIIKVVNLESRVDRKNKTIELFQKENITQYEFFKAVDGKKILPTLDLKKLFENNDFGSRRGVIGCALSHFQLWNNLIHDPNYDFYIIMEDDCTLIDNFKERLEILVDQFKEKEMVLLGYSMYEENRNKDREIYNNSDICNLFPINRENYIGGYFGYSINKLGAKKMIDHIEQNGIKHGIDYLIKVIPNYLDNVYECQPQLVFTEWNENSKMIDSDIQFNFDSLDFTQIISNNLDENFIFIKGFDISGHDLFRENMLLVDAFNKSLNISNCDGFNTFGYFKNNHLDLSELTRSTYYNENDGIYIKKNVFERLYSRDHVLKFINSFVNKEKVNKKYCFIHSCLTKEVGTCILDNLINTIIKSSLMDELDNVFIINTGEMIKENYFQEEKIKVIHFSNNHFTGENSTINLIHSFARLNPDCAILFLHTKGILHFHNLIKFQLSQDWVNFMLHFLVTNYTFCLELGKKYDAIGCNYIEYDYKKIYKPHFSGNFWWSNTNYLKNLEKVDEIFREQKFSQYRHQSEFWLLSSTKYINHYCLFNSNVNHYENEYLKENYIHHDYSLLKNRYNLYKKTKIYRVKLICNWDTSENICNQWSDMCEEKYRWKNIEITWENKNIDYYVIINKPWQNEYYNPSRTIIFQMEPWVYDEKCNWGVKTWGEWAEPDENNFLSVNGRKTNTYNNAFWELGLKLPQLIDFKYEKINKISSICSNKYFDPGHILRIDLLKYIESKNDLEVDIYNKDNSLGWKNYKHSVSLYTDKYLGIVNYKYYFMMENNFEENFITEKMWEPILCECLVFYYGCPNVSTYINPLAYVELDITDFEKSYQIMKKAVEEDWWSQRIDIIRQEKQKILNEMAFFPRIQKIIEEREG